MRIAVVVLVLFDLFLVYRWRRVEEERADLVSEKAELLQGLDEAEASGAERTALVRLLEAYRSRAESSGSTEELGIARLRDELLGAERDLEIDRLSLDFRPEPQAAGAMTATQVNASLRGSYSALFEYLARIEKKRLPLAPVELSLREDGSGSVALTIRWVASWPGPGPAAAALSPAEVAELSSWLDREEASRPGRSLFAPAPVEREPDAAPAPEVTMRETVVERAPDLEAAPVRETPALSGFVLARAELEPDVSRRVLAALRYRGELHLVAVGDTLDGFRVESVEARESVTLTSLSTGEELVLRLE